MMDEEYYWYIDPRTGTWLDLDHVSVACICSTMLGHLAQFEAEKIHNHSHHGVPYILYSFIYLYNSVHSPLCFPMPSKVF